MFSNAAIVLQHAWPIIGKQVELTIRLRSECGGCAPAATAANRKQVLFRGANGSTEQKERLPAQAIPGFEQQTPPAIRADPDPAVLPVALGFDVIGSPLV